MEFLSGQQTEWAATMEIRWESFPGNYRWRRGEYCSNNYFRSNLFFIRQPFPTRLQLFLSIVGLLYIIIVIIPDSPWDIPSHLSPNRMRREFSITGSHRELRGNLFWCTGDQTKENYFKRRDCICINVSQNYSRIQIQSEFNTNFPFLVAKQKLIRISRSVGNISSFNCYTETFRQ